MSVTWYGQILIAAALLVSFNVSWSAQIRAEGLFAVRDGVVSLANHDFEHAPRVPIIGNWRILPQNRAGQEEIPARQFLNPNKAFLGEWWEWDLPHHARYRRLSLSFDVSRERNDLALVFAANHSIRALRVLEDASKEAIFQQTFDGGLAESLVIPLGQGQRFQIVMIADLKSYRNSFQAYYPVIQQIHWEDIEQSAFPWQGLHLGALAILFIYFSIIIRIVDFRSLAFYGLFSCLLVATHYAFEFHVNRTESSLIHLNFPWLIRIQTLCHLSLIFLFLRFHNIKIFSLLVIDSRANFGRLFALSLPLIPFGVFTAIAPYVAISFLLTTLMIVVLHVENRQRSSLSMLIPLGIMALGAFADWHQTTFAVSWQIGLTHGILLSLCWQAIQSLLKLIAAFQYRQRKYSLQTNYLRHLFSMIRKDISKAMLIEPADYLQNGYDTLLIQRKLNEWRTQLAKIAGNMEKAEASLHRNPIDPGQVCQQVVAQELFDDCVHSIQDLIRTVRHSHLTASHNWQEKIPEIFTDRILINYVLYELIGKILPLLDQHWPTKFDLKFHVEQTHQLLFISIQVQQDSTQYKSSPETTLDWRTDRGLAEENFHVCLDFCQRILSNIKGRIHFKRPGPTERHLELELPLIKMNPISPSIPGQQLISREIITQLIAQRRSQNQVYQQVLKTDTECLHVAILSESASIYPLLHSCLQQAQMELLWLSNLEQFHQIKEEKQISLIIVYYEEDIATAEKLLLHLPQKMGDLASAVVVLTSDPKQNHHLRLYSLQIDDLIILPVSTEELILRLRSMIHRHRAIRMAHEYLEQKTLSADFHQIFLTEHDRIPGMAVEGLYLAADVTGGDWFQTFYDKRHHRFFAIVGDVAGRGRRSALIASAADAAFRALTQSMAKRMQVLPLDRCLWDLIEGINLAIYDAAQRCQRTMTVTFIAIDLNTGDALYSNAGHGPIYIVNDQNCDSMLIGGRPLGLARDLRLNYRRFHLSPDTAIFVSTDGLLRNQGPNGESLNQRQLIQVLSKTVKNQGSNIGEQVLKEVQSIWQDGAMVDDVVVLVIYWKHATNPMGLDDEVSA